MAHFPTRAVIAWFAFAQLLALALLLSLTACTLPQLGNIRLNPSSPASSGAAPGSTPSATALSSTSTAKATAAQPSDQPGGEVAITAQDFNDAANPPHGLILFTSTSAQPFKHLTTGTVSGTPGERYLWAVSTDGRRAGRISPTGQGSAMYLPAEGSKKIKVLLNGFQMTGADTHFEGVDLPEGCKDSDQNCGSFQFSPDGKLLAYLSGPDACGRTLTLLDLATRKPLYTWPNAHWAYFFKDGSLMTSLGDAPGDCQSQMAYLYIPRTGKQAGVEKIGKEYWNPAHTAVIFQVQGKTELQTGLWGFNLETSRVFLWLPKETVIEDTPIWLADGQHFVFQHQTYVYDSITKKAKLTGPRQIILMDAGTRAQRLLGFDGRNNYHLCGAADLPAGEAPGAPCAQPYGGWLRVQRLPFEPLAFAVTDRVDSAAQCALYGIGCKEQPEVLALNWQTTKQYPWEQALVPEATVTPSFFYPDLNKDSLYTDPNGAFAFYIGQDGHTLWYVPRDREPSLWVDNAEGFVYLP